MGRYTTADDVQTQLGITLTDAQRTYLNARALPAAEEWVDVTGGRVYGSSAVVAEPLVMGDDYTWLAKSPVVSVQRVRGYRWGDTAADIAVLPTYLYQLRDASNGYLYLPSWRGYAYIEIDYTPDATIPDRIKLAAAIVCGVYMRTVLHPETEWLTDYSSGQDVRFKFRGAEIPSMVYDLVGRLSNIVVA